MTDRKPTAKRWEKDGKWHITEPYIPTETDRVMFPVSYPPGDDGPFFVWSTESFDTEAEALGYIESSSSEPVDMCAPHGGA